MLAGVTVVTLLSGCGDDPSPADAVQAVEETSGGDASVDEGSMGNGGDAPAETCADLDVAVLESVEGTTPTPPPTEDERLAAFDRLAEGRSDEVAALAASVVPLLGLSADEVSAEQREDGIAALEGMVDWAAGSCELDGPVWACITRSSFQSVGEAIPDPDEEVPPPTVDVSTTPEEAFGLLAADGERVEVERTEDTVVFAWVDDRGLANGAQTVTRSADGGWVADAAIQCHEGG